MEYLEYKGKTLEEAITAATVELGITSDKLNYEVVNEGNSGFLGLFNVKPAVIRVITKKGIVDRTKEFCDELFKCMDMEVYSEVKFNEEEKILDIDLSGPNMGLLIGKRGQTLDSLQYIISIYVNKEEESYVRVKLDTENYRDRRKVTLERLAKKIAYTVKRTKKSVTLEPMNPYERRIIHSALQSDKYVCTKSEGEEPNRRVVIMVKRNR